MLMVKFKFVGCYCPGEIFQYLNLNGLSKYLCEFVPGDMVEWLEYFLAEQ